MATRSDLSGPGAQMSRHVDESHTLSPVNDPSGAASSVQWQQGAHLSGPGAQMSRYVVESHTLSLVNDPPGAA
jgi:hypothetical protein